MSDSILPDLVVRTRGHVTVVRLKTGNLTGSLEVQRIQDELLRLVDDGHTRLVLDLKNVTHAGSAALGMLLAVDQRLKQRSGRLVLSHAETIAQLLKISKTERLFITAPDPKEAIRVIGT